MKEVKDKNEIFKIDNYLIFHFQLTFSHEELCFLIYSLEYGDSPALQN